MHYLIDGHNLIGKVPGISLADPDDEVQLVLLLKQWAAGGTKRRPRLVTVYFDAGTGGGAARLSAGAVKVVFAPLGKTADSLLLDRLKKIGKPSDFTLVTSDRQILKEAEFRRIPYLLSEEFVEKELGLSEPEPTQKTAPPQAPLPPLEKPEEVSEGEVAEWLELFGPVPERPPQPKRRPKAPPEAQPPAEPEPVEPHTLKATKAEDVQLSPEEVAEWLRLFGPDPESKAAGKAGSEADQPQKGRGKKMSKQSPTLKTSKPADPRLSPEDLEEWLRYFAEDG